MMRGNGWIIYQTVTGRMLKGIKDNEPQLTDDPKAVWVFRYKGHAEDIWERLQDVRPTLQVLKLQPDPTTLGGEA